MTRLYEMRPDEARLAYDLEAVHRYGLPGVRCTGCGVTWSTTGVAYPDVRRSEATDAATFTDPRPVDVASFRGLVADVRGWFPAGAALVPGRSSGRWRGHRRELSAMSPG